MDVSKQAKVLAMISMVWSALVGGGLLVAIRLIQITQSSGHPRPFPIEIIAFYLTIEALLLAVLWGIRRGRRTKRLLVALLVLTFGMTAFCVRPNQGRSGDFMMLAFVLEAAWLAPWIAAIFIL